MLPDKEINVLLQLIDDPDVEVYDTVAARLIGFGKEIIPRLESIWGATPDQVVQERLEILIHRVYFNDLQQELMEWNRSKHPELLRGAILIAKYRFPDLNVPALLTQFDRIRKNIWLELNNYLTPLEQVNVLNSILYNYYKLQGHELTERNPAHFFINQVLDSKQGNSYSIGIIYLAVCEMLDIPVFAVDVPRQFIFAYIDTLHSFFSHDPDGVQQIQFYIDPISGMAYTQNDLEVYLRKINATDRGSNFKPLSTRRIIYQMLEELSLCYRYKQDDAQADDLQQLMKIIDIGID
ncbi:MAG: transglutaminase-like domain-containing protein [Taibaiella sp.]|nr:transglutaminase-like domain-containing protein [Taibaiella sp.]